MAEKIRITDLAQPVLTEQQQAAIDFTSTLEVDLSVASVLEEAAAQTGLDDFGPADFRERIALLCEEWNSDTGLRNIGRLTLRNKLLQHASSRLLIQDVLRRHPEIHDIEVHAPIIVAGLPRSGTTHLLNLMG